MSYLHCSAESLLRAMARSFAVTLLVPLLVGSVLLGPTVAADADNDAGSRTAHWIARKYIPDPDTRLGEVRVVAEADGLRVRTLLYSNLLKRVVAEIEIKSEAGWPEGSRYRAESRRYVADLTAAREEVWSRWRDLTNRSRLETTQTLLIDFTVTSARTAIDIGIPTLERVDGEYSVTAVESFTTSEYAPGFVRAETMRILADQFPDTTPDLAAKLPKVVD